MKDLYPIFGFTHLKQLFGVFLLTFFFSHSLRAQFIPTTNTGHGLSVELLQASFGKLMVGWERYSTSRWSTQVGVGYVYRSYFIDEIGEDIGTNRQGGGSLIVLPSETDWGGTVDLALRFRVSNRIRSSYTYIGLLMRNSFYDYGPEIEIWTCEYSLCGRGMTHKEIIHPRQLEHSAWFILGIRTNPFGNWSLEMEFLTGKKYIHLLHPTRIDPDTYRYDSNKEFYTSHEESKLRSKFGFRLSVIYNIQKVKGMHHFMMI